MLRHTLKVFLALLAFQCAMSAQISGGGGVTTTGAITVGHCVAFASATVIEDAGGTCGGTGSSPGGSSGAIQYNSSAVFGGTTLTDLSYSSHTLTLGSTGIFNMSAASVTAGVVLPNGAGAAPTTDAVIAFNTTNHLPVFGSNGSTLTWPSTIASSAHNWLTSYTNTTGVFTQSQPGFGDLTGSLSCTQTPALTGDTTTSAGNCSTTTSKVNGGSFPTSATVAATNSSNQLTAASLTNTDIWIGSASNLPVATAISGDSSMTAGGVMTNSGINGVNLAGLSTGMLKIATGTGTPSTVPLQGTDANILTSGTITGAAGTLLCIDASNGATTVSCNASGTGTVTSTGPPTASQFAYFTTATNIAGLTVPQGQLAVGNGASAPVANANPIWTVAFSGADRCAAIHTASTSLVNSNTGGVTDARGEIQGAGNISCSSNPFVISTDAGNSGTLYLPAGIIPLAASGNFNPQNSAEMWGTAIGNNNVNGPTGLKPVSFNAGSGATFAPALFSWGQPLSQTGAANGAGVYGPYNTHAGLMQLGCASSWPTYAASVMSGQDNTKISYIGINDCPVGIVAGSRATQNGTAWEGAYIVHSNATSGIANDPNAGDGAAPFTLASWSVPAFNQQGCGANATVPCVMIFTVSGGACSAAGTTTCSPYPGLEVLIGTDSGIAHTAGGTPPCAGNGCLSTPANGTNGITGLAISGTYTVGAMSDMSGTVTGATIASGAANTAVVTITATNDFPQDTVQTGSPNCTTAAGAGFSKCAMNALVYISGCTGGDAFANGKILTVYSSSSSSITGWLNTSTAGHTSATLTTCSLAYANTIDPWTYAGTPFTAANQYAVSTNGFGGAGDSAGSGGTVITYGNEVVINTIAGFRPWRQFTITNTNLKESAGSEYPAHDFVANGWGGTFEHSHLESTKLAAVEIGCNGPTANWTFNDLWINSNIGWTQNGQPTGGNATGISAGATGNNHSTAYHICNRFGTPVGIEILHSDDETAGGYGGLGSNVPVNVIVDDGNSNVVTQAACPHIGYYRLDGNGSVTTDCPPAAGPAAVAGGISNGISNYGGYITMMVGGSSVYSVSTAGLGTFTGLTSTASVNFRSTAHSSPATTGLTAAKPATCTVGDVYFATDATAGQNLYFCTTTNVFTQQLNSGASGANQQLSNLSAVALNSSLIPASDNAIDLGSAALRFRNEYLGGSLIWTTSGNVADTGLCRGAAGQVDVSSGGSCAATGNIFAAGFASGSATVPGTGEISLPSSAAPSAPASGTLIWFDSADLRVHEIGNAGTIGTTVVALANSSHKWLNSLGTNGVLTQTQPAISDLTATFTSPIILSTNTLSISGVTGEQGNGALLQLSTGSPTTNALIKFDSNGNTVVSDLLESSNLLSDATTTQLLTITGGKDASANSALGGLTLRGANETGAGGASSAGGPVLITGGSNAATNASSTAGSVLIEPGASTGATQGLQGILGFGKQYIKAATSTQWDLACISSTTAMTVKNCGASPQNWLGIIETANSNTDIILSPPSQSPINASAAVTVGDTVCAGSTAGQVTDSGGTSSCTNSQGATVGVVVAVSGTFTLGDGSTATISTTLPLIDMNSASTLTASGSAPSLDQVTGSASQVQRTETTAGNNYGFGGVETGTLHYPFYFTNASNSNNTSGALLVATTGTGTSQVPLVIAEDGSGTNTGDLLDAYLGATNTNGTLSGGTLEFAVSSSGTITTGALGTNVVAVTQSQNNNSTKVATTAYTDLAVANALAGVNPAVAVLAASTANLTGTYVQVGGGVGDTFTITATGTFTLDGITINTIGQRVLFKNQSTASQNGVYTATVVGTTGVSAVFTRALDYDTPSDVNNTGIIPVQSGTANSDTGWLLTSQVTSIGSSGSSLTYVQFGGSSTVRLDQVAAATTTTTIANGNNPILWNWAQTTDAQDAMSFGETSAATGGTLTNKLANQSVVQIGTASGSTATPIEIQQAGVTGTTGPPLLQLESTWNNSSLVGQGIYENVTNTSSAAFSNLLNLAVGNTTQLAVDKSGEVYDATYNTGNATTGSITVTPANGMYQSITLTGNLTIAFAQPTSLITTIYLKITQAAGGSDTVTWTSVKWPGGIAPVMTAAANAVDWYSCKLDGTNTYCTAGQNFQ